MCKIIFNKSSIEKSNKEFYGNQKMYSKYLEAIKKMNVYESLQTGLKLSGLV